MYACCIDSNSVYRWNDIRRVSASIAVDVDQYQQIWACYKVLHPEQENIKSYRIQEGQALSTELPGLTSQQMGNISVELKIVSASADWCVSVKKGELLIPDFELEVRHQIGI